MSSHAHDYGYAVGYVRALEAKLMQDAQVKRMLDAGDASESYAVLYDTKYAEVLQMYPQVEAFEYALEKELLITKKQLGTISPNDLLVEGITMWYDFYNVKTLLKASLQKRPYEEVEKYLSPLGDIPFSKLRNFAYNGASLRDFSFASKAAQDLYKQYNNLRFVDFVFDRLMFDRMIDWAHEIGSELLVAFVKKRIDLENAQIFFRIPERQRIEAGDKIFLTGGHFPPSYFMGKYQDARKYIVSIYGGNEALVKAFEQNQNFSVLQHESENILLAILHKSKYVSNGPEPIIAYWWEQERTNEIIRTILVAKLNGLDLEFVRKKIHIYY